MVESVEQTLIYKANPTNFSKASISLWGSRSNLIVTTKITILELLKKHFSDLISYLFLTVTLGN